MKRVFTTLVLVLMVLSANAQQRIFPLYDITSRTYDEALELMSVMERSAFIERMENVDLNADRFTTSGGEILLVKDRNAIKVIHVEFTNMIQDAIRNASQRFHPIEDLRTELIVQNSRMFEYIYERLYSNRNVKNIYIKIEPHSGISYIRVEYHNL